MKSFRIRIALLTGLISGTVLVGASLFLWEQTHQTSLEQLDRELRTLGHANLERRHGHTRYIELDKALNFLSATNSEYILHFTGSGRTEHTSTNWPQALSVGSFAPLTNYPPGVEVDPALLDRIKPLKGFRKDKSRANRTTSAITAS